MTVPVVMLIDGHSMAFRAFYALPVESFRTATGQFTNAVHGFTSMLINLLRDYQPTHLAVCFDHSKETFRTAQYPEYKGTRQKTPEEFLGQIELITELLDALGIAHLDKEGGGGRRPDRHPEHRVRRPGLADPDRQRRPGLLPIGQ